MNQITSATGVHLRVIMKDRSWGRLTVWEGAALQASTPHRQALPRGVRCDTLPALFVYDHTSPSLMFLLRVLSTLFLAGNNSLLEGCTISCDIWGQQGFTFDIWKKDISGTIISSQYFWKPLCRFPLSVPPVSKSWDKLDIRRKFIFQIFHSKTST